MLTLSPLVVGVTVVRNDFGRKNSWDVEIWELSATVRCVIATGGSALLYTRGSFGAFINKAKRGATWDSETDPGAGWGLGTQFPVAHSGIRYFVGGMIYTSDIDEIKTSSYLTIRGGVDCRFGQ